MSPNFEKLNEIKNQAYAKNSSCLSLGEVRNPYPLSMDTVEQALYVKKDARVTLL